MDEKQLQRLAWQILASTYRNPADWFTDFLGGGPTDAGVSVNANTALTYSTVWSCVDIISSEVASLPLNDTSLDDEGNKTINRVSQVQYLLNVEPNMAMTAFSFRRTLQMHVLLHGNGYAMIQRDASNRPAQLIPIHPTDMECVFLDEARRVWYKVSGLDDYFPASQMFHVLGLSDDGFRGISVITKARNSWGLGLAEEKHGSGHFKHGASPKVILKTDRNLTEQEAELLLKQWAAKQEGVENAGKTALAAGGLQIETVAVSNEDAQWLESRKFQRAEVATWFSMPEHMVNGERGPYNSTIAENQAFLRRTLKKHLCAWEQESKRKLLAERERRSGRRMIVHDTSELLSTDPEARARIQNELVGGEIITRNEARRNLGMNRHDDPLADQLSSPSTRRDNAPSEGGDDNGVGEEAVALQRQVIQSRMVKLIDTERRNITRGAKAGNFVEWIDTFYDRFGDQMLDAIRPIVDLCAVLPGAKCTFTATELVTNYVQDSKSQLLDVAGYSTPDDLVSHVTDATSRWGIRADGFADAVLGVVSCTQ